MQDHHTPNNSPRKHWKPCPTRQCVVCDADIPRHPGELPAHYRVRKTCSPACASVLRKQSQKRPLPAGLEKPCSACGTTMRPRPDEGQYKFNLRKTCSHECKVAASAESRRAKNQASKVCPICGVVYRRRANELPYDFRKRVTCSIECGLRHGAMVKRSKAPNASPYPVEFGEPLKRAIRERDGNQCRLCGSDGGRRNLHVHHINYDKQDCRPENLIALCGSCHCKTHTNREYWIDVFARMMNK